MYLVDTNVWLELLLDQERAQEARQFFENIGSNLLAVTDFSVYSIGIILTRLKKDDDFLEFLSDTIADSRIKQIHLEVEELKELAIRRVNLKLDFDDAYQYLVAEKHNLTLVSFDRDFDRTERGRQTPAQTMGK